MPSPDSQPELRSRTIKPPVMGLNTKLALSDMGEEWAVDCLNFFSDGSTVDIAKGSRYFAKQIGTEVCIIAGELALQSGTRKLLAIGDNRRMYDISAGGNGVDLSSAGTLLVDPDGLSVNFKNKIFFKGYDNTRDVYYWDGASATLTAAAFTGPGGDDKALFNPQVYKNRIYFCGYQTASFWYGDLNAITGTLTEFDLSTVLTKGGRLMYVGATTKQGAIDSSYFVAISDQGEVLLYAGSYPGEASQWTLIGQYYMPPPLGNRSFFNWGANLVIITYEGVLLLSTVLAGGNDLVYLTDNISSAFRTELAATNTSPYWSGVYYPRGRWLVINTYNNKQFVMSTITGAWWVWDKAAWSWGIYNNDIYYSSNNNIVYKADNGYFDESGSGGTAKTRTILLRPAYNYFGDTESFKQFTFCIPTVYQNNYMDITIDSNVDYANTAATSQNTDTSKGTDYQIYQPRCGLQGIGKCASIRIDGTVTDKRSSLQAIEVYYTEADPA